MADLMPTLVQCCRCSRQFPVRAQMNLGTGDRIPMLVVHEDVDNVEAALEQATCQVCLRKTGPANRGLYEILKGLGLKNEEDEASLPREAAVVVHVREESEATANIGVVVSDSRPREVAIFDPLIGTSIEMPRLELPAPQRGHHRGTCRDDWRSQPSEPRVPRALREAGHMSESSAPVTHLTGAIGKSGGNQAVLVVARAEIHKRDEARRLERAEKFDKLFFWLSLTLARIYKNAAKTEVWDLVDTFDRKLGEAASLDALQRGKKGLLVALGTSAEGLEELCLQFYQPREHLRIRKPEVVTMDAFEGGRRPEFWDLKGGKKPAFYQFEVVRTRNLSPLPNSLLPGADEDPR